METLKENFRSVNHYANNNETSRGVVNCFDANAKLSVDDRVTRESRQFNLHRCKSDSNGRRRSRNIEMGTSVSRSRSSGNLETDSIVFESLMERKSVKRDEKSLCSFGDSDDDEYKPLESSDDDNISKSETDDNNCITNEIQQCSDGHDARRGSQISESNNCIQQPRACAAITSANVGNEIGNALLCKKYSTLPHVKGNVDHDAFARRSASYKSLQNCGHCSMENMKVDNSELEASSEAFNSGDKATNNFASFRSTTLPKTRSRVSEPYSRHSLRHAIDLTMPRKHFGTGRASEHSAVIIPGNNESTSGTGKNV